VCLEDLASAGDDRFLQCVALPHRGPGLRLDGEGQVRWDDDDPRACALLVSTDGKLILLRGEESAQARVHRAGRSVDVPAGKPVVLLDKDEVEVGGRRLRLHVHGVTSEVSAPRRFVRSDRAMSMMGAMAAVVALGVGEPACDTLLAIEVRPQVPAPPPMPPEPPPHPSDAGAPRPDAGAASPVTSAPKVTTPPVPPPIEVREHVPAPPMIPTPPETPAPKKAK
jgi:hypothetical protein